jgi:hypothetical protein
MMMKNPDGAVVARLLPLVVGVLPLKQDFEENPPIFQCIYQLCKKPNSFHSCTISGLEHCF